jgi:hypothetical protein
MPKSLKIVLGVLLGFVVWFGVATVGNPLIRQSIAGCAEAEPAMKFTLPMLLARLTLGGVSSVAAGFVCAVALRCATAVKFFASLLVLFFIPVHCGRSFLFGITPSSWPPLRRSSSSAQRCHGRSRQRATVRPSCSLDRTVSCSVRPLDLTRRRSSAGSRRTRTR